MHEGPRTLEDLHQSELDGCRRSFRAGNVAALLSALHYCDKWDLRPPRWVMTAAQGLLILAIRNEWPRRSGRIASPGAQVRQDLIHYTRWDMVTMIREKQKELRRELDELRELQDVPREVLEDTERLLRRAGRSWPDAYACAAEELRGTEAFGSPETIKSSYQRVVRDFRNPLKAMRYRLPDFHTLRDLGLASVHESNRE